MYKLFKISGNSQNFPEYEQFHKLSTEFLPYVQKNLGFKKPVSVNLISDPENAKNPLGKTAYYEPEKMKITLFVDKRHVKDILRSMAHELVHHAQNCRGEFKGGLQAGDGYAQEDGKLREMEKEAYLKGQMLLRDWEDTRRKDISENKQPPEEQEISWETACIGAEPMKYFMLAGRDCEDALKKSWPDEGTCWFVPVPDAEKLMHRACSELNDPKRMAKRKDLLKKSTLRPSYVSFHRGPLRGQKIRVTGFDHAYQWAQSLGVYQFYYEGRKGKKFISKSKFKTDLYEYDPTRTGKRRQQENKIMKPEEEKKHDCSEHMGQTHEEWEAEQKEKTVLEQDDVSGNWVAQCKVPRGEKGYAWAGVVWKDSECLLKRANAGIDEEWNKWKLEGGGHVDGHSLTIVQCKDKDCEGRRNVTIHYEAGGAGVKSESDEGGTLSESWNNKKDKILFESLVNKWIK